MITNHNVTLSNLNIEILKVHYLNKIRKYIYLSIRSFISKLLRKKYFTLTKHLWITLYFKLF